jgi:pyruvate formate lyase activating enzyme
MLDRPPTPLATVRRAAELGRAAGLRHVYEGNVPGGGGERTLCHACGEPLVDRAGFRVVANRVTGGGCPRCATPLAGVGMCGDAGAARPRARPSC